MSGIIRKLHFDKTVLDNCCIKNSRKILYELLDERACGVIHFKINISVFHMRTLDILCVSHTFTDASYRI